MRSGSATTVSRKSASAGPKAMQAQPKNTASVIRTCSSAAPAAAAAASKQASNRRLFRRTLTSHPGSSSSSSSPALLRRRSAFRVVPCKASPAPPRPSIDRRGRGAPQPVAAQQELSGLWQAPRLPPPGRAGSTTSRRGGGKGGGGGGLARQTLRRRLLLAWLFTTAGTSGGLSLPLASALH